MISLLKERRVLVRNRSASLLGLCFDFCLGSGNALISMKILLVVAFAEKFPVFSAFFYLFFLLSFAV